MHRSARCLGTCPSQTGQLQHVHRSTASPVACRRWHELQQAGRSSTSSGTCTQFARCRVATASEVSPSAASAAPPTSPADDWSQPEPEPATSSWSDDTSDDEDQPTKNGGAPAKMGRLRGGKLAMFISKSTSVSKASLALAKELQKEKQVQLRGCGHAATGISVKTLGLASARLQATQQSLSFTVDRQEPTDAASLGKCYCYHIDCSLEAAVDEQAQGVLEKQQEFPVELEQYWRKQDQYSLFEERAHELADVMFDALDTGDDVYAVAVTNAQLVTSFEAVALTQRRLKQEGSSAVLRCGAYSTRLRGKNHGGLGTVLRVEQQREGQQGQQGQQDGGTG